MLILPKFDRVLGCPVNCLWPLNLAFGQILLETINLYYKETINRPVNDKNILQWSSYIPCFTMKKSRRHSLSVTADSARFWSSFVVSRYSHCLWPLTFASWQFQLEKYTYTIKNQSLSLWLIKINLNMVVLFHVSLRNNLEDTVWALLMILPGFDIVLWYPFIVRDLWRLLFSDSSWKNLPMLYRINQ